MKLSNYHVIRWAGGKRWLINHLDNLTLESYNNYHEPFLGGASLFLHLDPSNIAFLSDTNKELINTYIQIRDNLDKVWSLLKTFKNSKEEYYRIRDKVNYRVAHRRAARFLYLNRTSFNGIYRVNLQGVYNVPYGFKKYKRLFEYEKLKRLSACLQGVNLNCCDFINTLPNIKKGDLVYLDPPYTVSHQHNGFIKYNERLFSWKDQMRLKEYIKTIKDIGANYIMSNAFHKSVKDLFSDLDRRLEINRKSIISGDPKGRKTIVEYIFTNI